MRNENVGDRGRVGREARSPAHGRLRKVVAIVYKCALGESAALAILLQHWH